MRTPTAKQEAVLALGSRSEHFRVSVKDAGGTWRDLCSYPGLDMVDSASWGEDATSPGPSADVSLVRSHGLLSTSPLMSGSALNRGFDPSAAFAPLIEKGREFKLESALVPFGCAPAAGDWDWVFHGRIDTFDAASGDQVRFGGRDLSGRLADAWLRTERVYAMGAVSGLPVSMRVWAPSTAYLVGEYILPASRGNVTVGGTTTADPGAAKFYKCTTAGTSGTTEPAWPASSTIADGTAVHTYQAATVTTGYPVQQVMQNLLDDALGAGVVTLYVPTDPAFNVKPWPQERSSVLDALLRLALLFGGDVRYKWRAGTSQFELTVIVLDRAATTSLRTFASSEYTLIPKLAEDVQGMRNWVDLIYSDTASGFDANGDPVRKKVTKKNTTSIAELGELWMEISEDSAGQINTPTEANTMAQAAVDDCSTPDVDHGVDLVHGFHFVELNDIYTMAANNEHYDSDQKLAVYSHSHVYADGHLKTSFALRGKPSVGADRWHKASTNPGSKAPTLFTPWLDLFVVPSGEALTLTPVIAGVRVDIGLFHRFPVNDEREIHVSPTNGFAPSAGTLKGSGRIRSLEVADLVPGGTYYLREVVKAIAGGSVVRGTPGPQASFVAGYVEPHHLNPETVLGPCPPNGGFEARRTAAGLPTHWTMVVGAWGSGKDANWSASDRAEGAASVELLNTSVAAQLVSAYFPVRANSWRSVAASFKKVSGDGTESLYLYVHWYDAAKSWISDSLLSATTSVLGTGWWRLSRSFKAPSTAMFARVSVAKATAGAYGFRVDDIRLDGGDEPWHSVGGTGEPAFANSWVNYDAGSHTLAGFYVDALGVVHLRGFVKSGTATTVFTLPVGYRPEQQVTLIAMTYAGVSSVSITTAGVVMIDSYSATWSSLDGQSFRAAL